MRAFILVTGLAFALAACGKDDQAKSTVNVDQAVMADDLVANDVTAIDAVTGEAANMAADVDISFTNQALGSSNEGGSKSDAPKSPQRSSDPASPPAKAEPAGEATSNSTGNTTE